MEYLYYFDLLFKILLYGFLPLGFACLAWSAVTYKSDPDFFKVCAQTFTAILVMIGIHYFTYQYFDWHFKISAILESAIENGTVVDITQYFSPFFQGLASMWCLFAIAVVVLAFIPARTRRKTSTEQAK